MGKSKASCSLLLPLLITTLVILNFGAQDAKAQFTADSTVNDNKDEKEKEKCKDKDKDGDKDKDKDKDGDKDKGKDKDKDKDKGKGKDKGKCTAEIEVKAGPDQTITLPSSATLKGTASSHGVPAGSILTTTWSNVSGPGPVTFGHVSALITSAGFSAPGTYIIRL